MTSEDLDANAPVAAEAEPSKPSDTGSTRDELWQVQFDPNAAREVAARHLGRLMYSSPDDWSHYVFHENDPKA